MHSFRSTLDIEVLWTLIQSWNHKSCTIEISGGHALAMPRMSLRSETTKACNWNFQNSLWMPSHFWSSQS